jgi:hypothetical protein
MASFRRIEVLLCDHDSVQHEPEDIPMVEGAPVEQGTPDVETGAVGLRVKTSGGGLSPPTPNSVEPNGMPTRPTGDPNPIPVGDEADDAGPAVEPPATPMQVPDAFPIVPPPSKRADEPAFQWLTWHYWTKSLPSNLPCRTIPAEANRQCWNTS